jgi:hypothetical protein
MSRALGLARRAGVWGRTKHQTATMAASGPAHPASARNRRRSLILARDVIGPPGPSAEVMLARGSHRRADARLNGCGRAAC